jgi:hypothetical protein
LGTAFGAGCGLHELVHDLISRVLSIAPAYSGPLAFAGTVGGTWMLLRTLKRKLTEWIATSLPGLTRPWAGWWRAACAGWS